MEKGQIWRQYVIASIASIVVAVSGFSQGWSSPISSKLNSTDTSPLPDVITSDQSSWIGSLFAGGSFFGPFFAGFLVTSIGRKWGLLATAIPSFTGWILVAAATNVGMIYAGRFLWGMAMGMHFTITPMYLVEIATVDARGALGSFLQVYVSIGYLMVCSIGPFVSYNATAYAGIALAAIFVVTFFFMPESPMYHLTKNNREAAAESLMKIRGMSRAGVESELSQMAMDVQASMQKNARFADVFRGANLKALYISCALLSFQQLSGIIAVLFYMTIIFGATGSNLGPDISVIIVGAVQVLASLLTPFVVDRLGRKILLLISSAGTAIGLGLLGMYFLLDEMGSPAVNSLGFLPVVSMMLFIVTYNWGLGPLPWAIMSELMPIEIKAAASPIPPTILSVWAFLVTRFFQPVANAFGMYVVFWIFSICCMMSFLFTLFVLPETKGRTFAEIQDILAGRSRSEKEKSQT